MLSGEPASRQRSPDDGHLAGCPAKQLARTTPMRMPDACHLGSQAEPVRDPLGVRIPGRWGYRSLQSRRPQAEDHDGRPAVRASRHSDQLPWIEKAPERVSIAQPALAEFEVHFVGNTTSDFRGFLTG